MNFYVVIWAVARHDWCVSRQTLLHHSCDSHVVSGSGNKKGNLKQLLVGGVQLYETLTQLEVQNQHVNAFFYCMYSRDCRLAVIYEHVDHFFDRIVQHPFRCFPAPLVIGTSDIRTLHQLGRSYEQSSGTGRAECRTPLHCATQSFDPVSCRTLVLHHKNYKSQKKNTPKPVNTYNRLNTQIKHSQCFFHS